LQNCLVSVIQQRTTQQHRGSSIPPGLGLALTRRLKCVS
jgi:hypothetical protein